MLKKANVLHFIISRFLTLRYKETCCFKVLLLKKNIYTYSAANFILAVVTNIKQDYRFEFLKSSFLRSHSVLRTVTNSSVASSWNFVSDWVVFRTNIVEQRILITNALIKWMRQIVIQRLIDGFCQSNSFLIFSMRKFCPVNNKN